MINVKKLKKLLSYSGFFYNKKKLDKYHYKGNFLSTHSITFNLINKNSKILDIGCYDASLAKKIIKKKNCYVDGVDFKRVINKKILNNFFEFNLNNGLPKQINYNKYNYILMLDVIEHLDNPEKFISNLRKLIKKNKKTKIILSTPNIAFFIIRLSLLFGNFNYSEKGILDYTHKRLFTFNSFTNLLINNNFKIEKKIGIPAPFPLVLGKNFISLFMLNFNNFLIKINKKLFSFQMLFIVSFK